MLTEKNDYFDSMGAFSSFSPDDPEKKKGNNGYEAYHGGDTLVNGGNNGVYRQTRKHLGADIRNAKINLDGSGFNKKYNMIDSDGRLRSFRDYHAISKRWVRGEAGEDDNIEERNKMRTTYSTTDTAFNDIAGEYYKNVVVGNFKKNRAATKKKAQEVYTSYMSVIGADPELAMRQMISADKPQKDLEKTMQSVDVAEIRRLAEPVALYAGYDPDEYVQKFILPTMYNRLVDELVKENVPKNPVEYILRSSLDNSLIGKVSTWALSQSLDDDTNIKLSQEGLYTYKPNWAESLAGNVGGLLVDLPVFGMLGSTSSKVVGKTTGVLAENLAKKIVLMKGGEAMTKESAKAIAKRAITSKLANRMALSASTQGLTLGTYDAANSVADDLLAGDGVDAGKALKSFTKGAATGAVLGVVGTPMREFASLQKGFNKFAASVGVLGTESAVFTGFTQAEKLANDIEITPVDLAADYAESMATLGIMKAAHWRPKGLRLKLDRKGQLQSAFRLSSSERAELEEMNIQPDRFMELIQRSLKLPSFEGKIVEDMLETYSKVMSNEKVSASAKSKLMFLVENKISSTLPLPVDYFVDRGEDGKWNVTYYDEGGRKISTEKFDNAGNAKSRMLVQSGKIRRNRILFFESELTAGLESQNFIRQAGLFAKKNKVDVNLLAEAMYKKATGEELLPEESRLVDKVLEKAAYDDAGMVQNLYELRRRIEKKHGLESGTLMHDIDKEFYRIDTKQNDALDEYQEILRGEFERLKGGTVSSRYRRMLEKGLNSEYFGMTNEEVKQQEYADYEAWVAIRDADRTGLTSKPHPVGERLIRRITIPDDDNSGYVWSANGVKNTKTDIEQYKERAQALADKFGVKLNFISDEHEIPLPPTPEHIMDYNMMVKAEGWSNLGRVYLNLPNVKSVEHAEKVVLHEVVAHRGLLGVFGDNLYEFMEDVYRKASPDVLRGIGRIKRTYGSADGYTLVEEYLAHLAEKVNPTPQERSIKVRVKDYIRSLLIRMKLYTGSNRQISEKELAAIMQRHSEYMMKRRKPDEYRKEVFGSFKSAHANEDTYYNYDNYIKGVRERAERGELFTDTPRFFRDVKGWLNYEHLPEKMQERVRSWLGKSDEEIRTMKFGGRYRMPEDETGPLPRSGVTASGEARYGRVELKAEDIKLWDPFYRVLKVHFPLYAMEYKDIFNTPVKEWTSDHKNRWNRLTQLAMDTDTELVLGDVINNPEIFKKYPQLRSVPLEIKEGMDRPVMYDRERNLFVVDKRAFMFRGTKKSFASSIDEAAAYYDRMESAVNREVSEMNVLLSDKYNNAIAAAWKLRRAKMLFSGFDQEGKLSSDFKRSYGFAPEEFIERFPKVDDYFIYRLSRGMNKMKSEGERVGESNSETILGTFRKFFIGPIEVIINAGTKAQDQNGPLRLKDKSDPSYNKVKSGLEKAEDEALTRDLIELEYENRRKGENGNSFWWTELFDGNDEERAIGRYLRRQRDENRRRGGKDEDLLN